MLFCFQPDQETQLGVDKINKLLENYMGIMDIDLGNCSSLKLQNIKVKRNKL